MIRRRFDRAPSVLAALVLGAWAATAVAAPEELIERERTPTGELVAALRVPDGVETGVIYRVTYER